MFVGFAEICTLMAFPLGSRICRFGDYFMQSHEFLFLNFCLCITFQKEVNFIFYRFPTANAPSTPIKEEIKTIVYPVGKSMAYESTIEIIISIEPITHE